MGSNIIELAKLGHERAAELKASCGAVDVRSFAQLISDLATQLEVQLVRGNAQEVQLDNAESKCRELAAENAALKKFGETLFEMHDALNGSGTGIQGNYEAVCQQLGLEAAMDALDDIKTPATDAFLAEVLASARNEGINYAAGRLAAAFNHGFLDKPVAEVLDVTRMILSAKEDLANDSLPATDGLSGEYAEKAIEEWEAQLRKGAAL
ncbi:hypothetical protein AB4297_003248 [Salmonella enterica]